MVAGHGQRCWATGMVAGHAFQLCVSVQHTTKGKGETLIAAGERSKWRLDEWHLHQVGQNVLISEDVAERGDARGTRGKKRLYGGAMPYVRIELLSGCLQCFYAGGQTDACGVVRMSLTWSKRQGYWRYVKDVSGVTLTITGWASFALEQRFSFCKAYWELSPSHKPTTIQAAEVHTCLTGSISMN